MTEEGKEVPDSPTGSFHDQMAYYEKQVIAQALQECENNVTHAAEKLGLGRSHLHKKIKALNIK